MHKKLLLIAFALLSCQALLAQEEEWSWSSSTQDKSYRFELGPKIGAGLALATKPTNYSFNFSSGLAYQVGLSANMHFGRRYSTSPGGTGWFGLEAEILYGGRMLGIEGTKANMTMHCIEIPLLLQFYPAPSLAIEAGSTLTKIIKCSPEELQLENVVLNTGQLASNDVMITMGVAYKTPINLMLDLRYNMGLFALAGNLDSKISSLKASIVYVLKLSKD